MTLMCAEYFLDESGTSANLQITLFFGPTDDYLRRIKSTMVGKLPISL
jgi:hypothetical protein